jgi:hypothetical protein
MISEQQNQMAVRSDTGAADVFDNSPDSLGPHDSQSGPAQSTTAAVVGENSVEQSLGARKAGGPRTTEGKKRSKGNALKHGIFSAIALVKGESQATYDSLLCGLLEAVAPVGKLEELLVEKLAVTAWRYRRFIQAEVAEIQKGNDLVNWEQQVRKEKADCPIDWSSLMKSDPGLISKIDNPFVLQRCLDLLAELREQFEQNGFNTETDSALLTHLYGDANKSTVDDNLHDEYLTWFETAGASDAERSTAGYATPEECKDNVLAAIDLEMRRLKERQKIEAVCHIVPAAPSLDRLLRYEASLERSFDRSLSQLERLQRMRLGHPVPPPINLNVSSS